MRAGSNLPAVGGYNQAVILDAVRRAPDGVSRVEVASRTGLSAQTATNIVRRLIDEGLVVEAGTRVNGVGKPRTILRLEPRGRLAVGVHLDPSVITLVLLDLAGKEVARRTLATTPEAKASRTIARIVRAVSALIAEAAVEPSRVIGVGIAAPGPIDVVSGVVLNPPLLTKWHDVPVRDELADALGLPVILEKDVTAAAVAELWMDTTGERSDMVFMYCGTGVGIGVVSRGEVVRGFSNNAGDVGSIIVGDVSGETADRAHDRRGRFGWAMSPRLMVEDAIASGVMGGDATAMTTAEVASAYAQLLGSHGDPRAVALMDAAVADIAQAMLMLVNLLDVDHVVFGGPYFAPLRDAVLSRVPEMVMGSPLYRLPHAVTFGESAIGDDVAAVGAACLVLDHTLSPSTHGLLIPR
ncbi:ROK family transcriptional regulator [Rathayibacter soli]|uniref:ROK family transcriptional regulator n=1 Tax=Rathayibacter soli TaxID=3144168 RepID=UPI0027E3EA14|nr:ROK family transcriptional regulator [Glaciibacter superstes]